MSENVSQLGLSSLVERDVSVDVSQSGAVYVVRRDLVVGASEVGVASLVRRSVRPTISQVGLLMLCRMYEQGDANQVIVTYDLGYLVTAQTLSLQLAWAGPMTMLLEHSDDQEVWDAFDTGIVTITNDSYDRGTFWNFDTHAVKTRYWRMTATSFVDRLTYGYPAMTVISMRAIDPFGEPLSVSDPLDQSRVVTESSVIQDTDVVLLPDCASPISLLLPRASGPTRLITIYKTDSSGNNVSLVTRGNDTSEVISLTTESPFVRLTNSTTSDWTVA